MGWVRLELTTNGLKGRCSTIELPAPESLVNFFYLTNDPAFGEVADAILLLLSAVFIGGEEMGLVNDRTRGHISIDNSILAFVNEGVFFGWE